MIELIDQSCLRASVGVFRVINISFVRLFMRFDGLFRSESYLFSFPNAIKTLLSIGHHRGYRLARIPQEKKL